ncbi:MAG: metallophosphoesterase family protein [Tannerella sp.]|jgi:hypothetical protein|nr:metallophosphoesterase family protein [Tannerella sp.]
MKIKIIAAFLFSMVVSTFVTAQPAKPELKFGKNGRFKIMQVTDTHYNALENAGSTQEFLREAIRLVQPDLIMLTGDIVVSENTRRGWQEIAGLLTGFRIPWAVVLGNHDSEYELTNKQIIELLSEYPDNLTENGPEDITGNGNYVLPVISSTHPDRTAASLYCFDTRKQHEWIDYTQMDWYRQQSRRLAGQNGGKPLPALAFYHVPVPEYNEVIGKPTTVGLQQETVCCPTSNSGSFVAMYECGDVMGIFVGHDHDNNYIGCLHGICLAYGFKSGRQSYGKIGRGVRVIELCEGERKFNTHLLHLYDCNRDEGTWTPVRPAATLFPVTFPDSFAEKK